MNLDVTSIEIGDATPVIQNSIKKKFISEADATQHCVSLVAPGFFFASSFLFFFFSCLKSWAKKI